MTDRLAIQVLRKAGLTLQQVVEEVGVSKRSVQEILMEPAITNQDCGLRPKPRGVGRLSVVAGFRAAVAAVLPEEPSLPTRGMDAERPGVAFPRGA